MYMAEGLLYSCWSEVVLGPSVNSIQHIRAEMINRRWLDVRLVTRGNRWRATKLVNLWFVLVHVHRLVAEMCVFRTGGATAMGQQRIAVNSHLGVSTETGLGFHF